MALLPANSSRALDTALLLAVVVAGAALLVTLGALRELGRPAAAPELLPATAEGAEPPPPPDAFAALFDPARLPRAENVTNALNPFFTAYFKPPPPPPAPQPPPKVTRKVALSYQGLIETARGERRAYVMVDTNLLVGVTGTPVVGPFQIGNFDRAALVLQQNSTQAVVLPFRAPREVEIPAE